MSVSVGSRLANILPDALKYASLRRRATVDQVVASGLQLGGIFTWGIVQGRFTAELLGSKISSACEKEILPARFPSAPPGIKVLQPLPSGDASIAGFRAAGEHGEPLRLMMSLPIESEKLSADIRLVEYMVGMLPRHSHYISKADLVTLIEDIAYAAALDGDLAEEARGLHVGKQSDWFEAPRAVLHSNNLLVVTDLAGVPIEDLPAEQRADIYCRAVANWSRLLLDDGILNVTLRRDRLLIQEAKLGLTRWAGTRPSSSAAQLIRNLVLASFGLTDAARETARDQAAQLLADGLGMEGAMDEIEAFCLSLISENEQLTLKRRNFKQVVARQSNRYSQEQRVDMFQLLRQLVWLRDLGLACGVADLSRPWQELAQELSGSW